MGRELPPNPYPINRKVTLHTYVFFKQNYEVQRVDKLLADFVLCLMSKPFGRNKKYGYRDEVVIWRGEYTNDDGTAMWTIGIPENLVRAIQDMFRNTMVDMWDDNGIYNPSECGCKPFLLLTPDQIWQFDGKKPPLSEGSLKLAGAAFSIRYIPYVYKREKQKKPSKESIPFLEEILKFLEDEMTDSPIQNQSRIREFFEKEILFDSNGAFADYWGGLMKFSFLKQLCNVLCLPIIELPIKEYGRIVARPIWKDVGDGRRELADYSLAIVLNNQLTEPQKMVALAHELGHYVYHLPFILFFARLQAYIQANAQIEHLVALYLDSEWWEKYHTITEQRADWVASFFAAPPRVMQMLNKSVIMDTPDVAALFRYLWLKSIEDGISIRGNQTGKFFDEAKQVQNNLLSMPYTRHSPLFERIAWCTFQQEKTDLQIFFNEYEKLTMETLRLLELHFKRILELKKDGITATGQIYQRVRLEEVEDIFWKFDKFDPIIVEPASGPAQGYIGLTPRWIPKTKGVPIDWASWMNPNDAVGFLNEWLVSAQRENKGLMLFLISPLEKYGHQVREQIEEGGALIPMIQKMLFYEDTESDE